MKNENQNEVIIDGVRYVIKNRTQYGCGGCVADRCATPEPIPTLCIDLPPCSSDQRDDGKDKVWVKHEE